MTTQKNMYKPLPESLTVKTSKVNGLGLFAKEGIAQGTNLGMTHTKIGDNIIIDAYSFIYRLHIYCLNSNGVFSDNYFEMLPGETLKIEFKPTENYNIYDHTFLFELKSIYDLMN